MRFGIDINPTEGPGPRPTLTLLCYLLFIGAIYTVLIFSVGRKTALLYLGLGRPHYEVLISFLELKRDLPENQKRIFYLADSTVDMVENSVAPPAVLQRELEKEYGEDSVQVVEWAFGGATMFHYYCLLCKAEDYSPSLVVLNVNYRSYGSGWQDLIRDEKGHIHCRELAVLAPFRESFSEGLSSPLEIEKITLPGRLKIQMDFWEIFYIRGVKLWLKDTLGRVVMGEPSLGKEWKQWTNETREEAHDLLRDTVKLGFNAGDLRRAYPMEVPADHREVLGLRAVSDALRRRNIPFIAYLTPFNIPLLREYGVVDDKAIERNVMRIKEIVETNGGIFLNMVDLLETEDFEDLLEHYNPEGGEKVARELLPEVKKVLWND